MVGFGAAVCSGTVSLLWSLHPGPCKLFHRCYKIIGVCWSGLRVFWHVSVLYALVQRLVLAFVLVLGWCLGLVQCMLCCCS